MSKVLAIGDYSDVDRAALDADLNAIVVADNEGATSLDEATRAGITAISFKGHQPIGGDQMDAFPNLGLIANYGVGYDAIDTTAAVARGVAVTNTPDVLSDDVADLAVAMILSQSRRMRQAEEHVRSGDWAQKGEFPLNRKASGATAGILGLGRIGREIADRLAAFKMDIHYWSRSEKDTPGWSYHASPVSLAGAVDYLVVALVGGKDTEAMVSGAVLDALGRDGVVVNISRGSTIDEGALLDRLEDGRIAGAGLDVFIGEPNIDTRFLSLDNVVLQPHQGSGTHATRAAMGQLQRDNISAFLDGAPLLTRVA